MFAAVTESLLVFSDGLKIQEVCTKLGGVMDDPKNVLSFKTIGVFLNANNEEVVWESFVAPGKGAPCS